MENNNKKTILVVDDEIGSLTLISLVLESRGGFSAIKAHNAASALEVLKNTIPDLIIADIMMPGIDGVELCRKIKEDPKTKNVPVILLTARADQKDQGLAAGADAYLLKPILYNNLVQAASKALNLNSAPAEEIKPVSPADHNEIEKTTAETTPSAIHKQGDQVQPS